MRSSLCTLGMASLAVAHTRIWGVSVDGQDQGDGRGTYVRSPPDNSPVKDITSPDMICNTNPAAVPDFVTVAAGATLTTEWYHDNRGDDIIAASHHGPILTYLAPYADDVTSAGGIWTKIAEAGYDGSAWAVDKLIADKGKLDVTIPASLKAGRYLLRQEIIALHEGDASYRTNAARGAQFYPSCVQIDVTGGGEAVPDQAFDVNTGYTDADPGIVFNVYGSFTEYPIPGPAVWEAASAGGGSGPRPSSSQPASAPSSTVVTAPTSAAASSSAVASTSAVLSRPIPRPAYPTTLVTSSTAATNVSATAGPASTRPACRPRKVRKH